jgi:ATP-dependent 26S proteasome regulatory subunit
VATFLAEMDGLEVSGASSSSPPTVRNMIDAALLRDGRCDRRIKLKPPSAHTAVTIMLRAMIDVPVTVGHSRKELAQHGADACSSCALIRASTISRSATW